MTVYFCVGFHGRRGSGQIFDWIYGKLVGFFSEFFEMMNMMGAELFDLPWTQAVVLFFSRFAWSCTRWGL